MTVETISYRFVVRRGTAAAWTATNGVLLAGEWGLESDTKKLKMGDGATAWSALPYLDQSLHLAALADVDNTALADGKSLVWSASLSKHVYKKAAGNYQPGVGIAIDAVTNPDAPVISSTVAAVGLKGRVATYAALPASGNIAGDAYLVDADSLVYVWSGTAWPTQGAGLSVSSSGSEGFNVPLASSFTAVGSGLTATNKVGRLQLSMTPGTFGAGGMRTLVKAIPAAPYTLDFCGSVLPPLPVSGDAQVLGLCLYDGTKYRGFYLGHFNKGGITPQWVAVDSWTSQTVFGAQVKTYQMTFDPSKYYLRITNDGTTLRYYVSSNGKDYQQVYSEPVNTFLTPTKCGLLFYSNTDPTQIPTVKSAVLDFTVTASVLGDDP